MKKERKKVSKAFLKRQKAKMYVAMAYRNQEYLEDYHVSGKALNEEAYEKMHAVVNQAIMEYSDTINTALTVYGKSREELVGIHNIDIAGALISALMVDAWDDPIKVRERMKEQDVAEFILIIELWGLNLKTDVQSKKALAQLTEK